MRVPQRARKKENRAAGSTKEEVDVSQGGIYADALFVKNIRKIKLIC